MAGKGKKLRSLSGIRPSGNVHIGNYLGMIKPALEYQREYNCIYFIADMHALTTLKDRMLMRQYTLDLAATWLALGLDVENHIFFRQSDVPAVAEYAWYLACFTGVGFLEKAHAYKDAKAANKEVNHGILSYPVLMAADILMYDVDIVPVGKDQKQHVEMARDMAGSVNAVLGDDTIKLPKPVIKEEVKTIPGLDGRKMSKSYGNEIPLFCEPKVLKKRVMSIKTDSTPLEEPKDLDGSVIGELYAHFSTDEEYADLKGRLKAGGVGWGHAKEDLFKAIDRSIGEARERYFEYRKDENLLEDVLRRGAEKASLAAAPQLERIRERLGFNV
ncbi:MAG: tryptophan--tRNA ligase [Candidatus Dadabacteria bacterium]|nr:MAG: tryptophan--tRNA ligase [Candidatus Dadabacteria bacterium]